MTKVYKRKIHRQGTSLVISLPLEIKNLGFYRGRYVNMFMSDDQLIIMLKDDVYTCKNCNGKGYVLKEE